MAKSTSRLRFLPREETHRRLAELVPQKELNDAVMSGELVWHYVGEGGSYSWSNIKELWSYLRISSDDVISSGKRERRKTEQERTRPVACELWPPDGLVPDDVGTEQAVADLRYAQKLKGERFSSPTTIKRVIGRVKEES
jgi:hypothetical protein